MPDVVMEIITILTIFGIKRRTRILTKIGNCGSFERQNLTIKMRRRNFMNVTVKFKDIQMKKIDVKF